MKMNWGTGIFITLVIFLIGMMTLVIISSMQPLNLVSPDYYPKGIDYQKQINKISRVKALDKKIEFSQNDGNVYIEFPSLDSLNTIDGEILFFFPRDSNLDQAYKINVNEALIQVVSTEGMAKGRCIIKVDWSQNSIDYYLEQAIMIK